MLSESTLSLIDLVAKLGSFTAAANQLNKVPSAVSYSIKQAEDDLGTKLFVRHYRSVTLTPAGEHFINQARVLIKQIQAIKASTQRVANNWQPAISITLDTLIRADKISSLISNFYKAFDDVELTVRMGVFNGVWESLTSGESDLAVGSTVTIPNGGRYKFRDMGQVNWSFCVSPKHHLAAIETSLSNDELVKYPVVCVEDTARNTPKRELWRLQNQRKIIVPDWIRAINCVGTGLGVGFFPSHLVDMFVQAGRLVEKQLQIPLPAEPCCIAWRNDKSSNALQWLINYLSVSP